MQSSNVRIEQLLRFKVDNIFQAMLNDDNMYIYIYLVIISINNFLHLLMVNLWQQNVHPGPTWIFWEKPLLHDKKEHGLDLLETCWHHLKGGAPWQTVRTVRRDSDNPERSHGFVKSKHLFWRQKYSGIHGDELLLMGCTDFK